jgi:outer membrane protein OmpA-like peptidoglycan-associated protein
MLSQNEKSKADKLFYEYKYERAINEYAKERVKNQLTNHQLLNLADSYFNTGSFEDAAKFYVEVNKNDTIMSVHRFNKMLQSLSKGSDKERVKTFLKSKTPLLSPELLENSEFNYSLLESTSKATDFEIKNLSSNSPQGDISPAFYKDGLLFSSSRAQKSKNLYEPSGESYLDIYFGKLSANRDINTVEVFNRIPDSKFHQATPFYSEELATFYYILSNTEDGELAFDENAKNALAVGAMKENGQFRFILKDLSTSFYYPFFDGKTDRLFFAANFDDSFGGTDLYYVYTNNGQIMSAPVNLGPRINSPGNEIAPYIFEGSLYFSSDVFYGLGGMDVYKASIIGDDSFTIPVNLGTGINSETDDFGLIITKNEDNKFEGYFASNRKGGKGGDDLYGFSTDENLGLKTFALRGKVVNLSKDLGLDKVRVRLISTDGEMIKEAYSDANGNFRIEIPWRSQIVVQITKEGYSLLSTSYTEEGMEEIQKSPYKVELVKMEDLLTESENKSVLKLNKFYFEKGKAVINPEVATELDKVVLAVSKFPQLRLKIETHTDSRGSSSSNKRLSQDRSDAIKSYLIKNGLSPNTILESIGYGEEMIRNNCTNGAYCLDFLHQQNERTLIVVVD